jgi:hypothetical protein
MLRPWFSAGVFSNFHHPKNCHPERSEVCFSPLLGAPANEKQIPRFADSARDDLFLGFGSASWELQVWDFADMRRSGAAPYAETQEHRQEWLCQAFGDTTVRKTKTARPILSRAANPSLPKLPLHPELPVPHAAVESAASFPSNCANISRSVWINSSLDTWLFLNCSRNRNASFSGS